MSRQRRSESTTKGSDSDRSSAAENGITDGTKSGRSKRLQSEEQLRKEGTGLIWERWLEQNGRVLIAVVVMPSVWDRLQSADWADGVVVEVHHVVDDSAADDEEAPSFVGNDVETMMVWIDGKLEAMKGKRRKGS